MRIVTISFLMIVLAAWTTQTTHAQADLSMLSFDVVETSATGNGSTLTVNFEVQNTGTAASGTFTTTFYYSDNTGFNSNNTTTFPIVGSATVSPIAAGGTSGILNATLTLTSYTQSGTRYIHYFVDSDNDVAESNENNNRSTQVTDPNADEDDVLITGLPNLRASITSLSASSGTLGDVITVNYRISNAGVTRTPSSFWTNFYLSTDAVYDTGDLDLSRETQGSFGLQSGSSFTEAFDVTIPPGLTAGNYFILVYADRFNTSSSVTESDESDNTDAEPFTLTAGPDLVMDTFSFTATPSGGTLGFGDAVDFSFTVRNQGSGAAGPFTIYFFYDDDTLLSFPYPPGTTNQPVIATFDVSGGLAAGATLANTVATTLPSEVLNGARFLHYYIDVGASSSAPNGNVFELDETNNTGSASITITGLPDLTVDAICASPSGQAATACSPTLDVVRGGTFNIHTRLANIGKARVISQSTRLYFSTDATIDPSTDTPLTSIGVGIDAGEFSPSPTTYHSRNVTLPSTAPGGTGFVGAFADFNALVTESDEANNAGSTAINVLAPPDLVMDSFSISTGTTSADGTPSAPGLGSNVDLTFTVRNQGTTDAGAFSVRFFYNDDTATPGTGTHLNTTTFSTGLAAGATTPSATVTVSMPGDVLYGLNADGNARFIHYNVDPFLQVPEDNETNNTGATPIDITGLPDLEVIRVCLFASGSSQQCTDDTGYTPPTQVPGGQLVTTYTILNNGLSRAWSIENGLYFSTDATIDTSDQLLTITAASVNAGSQAFPNPFFITLPAGVAPGPAYVGLLADHNAQFTESDETNNTGAAEMIVASGIDLVMANFSVPDAPGANSTINLSFEVDNVGANNAGAFTVRFLYDDDTDASSGQTSLRNCSVASIPAGGTSGTQTCSVTLPSSVLFGTRFIHYAIDVNNQVSESDEINNAGTGSFQVTGRPDLLFTVFTVSPSQLTPGQPATVDYTFTNSGFSRTDAAFITRIYYSDDALLDPNTDDLLDSQTYTDALNVNGTHTTNRTVTIPATASTAGGTLFGVVDADAAITEENDGNNSVSSDIALPVELTSFEAVLDGEAVLLYWETASETNNAGFEIQRIYLREPSVSKTVGATGWSPQEWQAIAFIEGQGTTAEAQRYTYRVEGLSPGPYTFRLKQIDFDGAFEYSPETDVTVELATAYLLSPAYPNPFNPQARFTVAVRQPQHAQIAVYDVRGRRVAHLHNGLLDANRTYTFTLDGSRWTSGLYFYEVVGERFRTSRSVLLVK